MWMEKATPPKNITPNVPPNIPPLRNKGFIFSRIKGNPMGFHKPWTKWWLFNGDAFYGIESDANITNKKQAQDDLSDL